MHTAEDLDEGLRLFALRLSLDSTGASGVGVRVNESALMGVFGLSSSTVWRRVRTLVDRGWLAKSRAASKTERAEYVLLVPGEASSVIPPRGVTDDQAASSVTAPRGMTDDAAAHDGSSVIGTPSVTDDSPGSSVTNHRAVTDDRAETPSTSVTPHGPMTGIQTGTTTAAAAAREGTAPRPGTPASGPVADLAATIARHRPLAGLRWDALGAERMGRVEALVELHGAQALADVAITTMRTPAPTYAQAFLGSWEAIPAPRPPTIAAPCESPGHTGTIRHCAQCASEQKAAS